MISIEILFVFILSVHSQRIYECDFDYGQKCLPGLLSASTILLNETSEEPRQPASDVTAIMTSNDEGECFFPFQLNSFDMFFCEQNDSNLPATCPTFNTTGPRINCSEGEYGYEKFDVGETGSRSYKLDALSFSSEEYCIRFYYYLSDENSNGSVTVILEDDQLNQNTTIVTASTRSQNRWYQIRKGFTSSTQNPTIYFVFERESSSNSLPFYIAVDDITIIDLECEPDVTNTTESTSTTTGNTTSISSSTTTTTLPGSTVTSASSSTTTSTIPGSTVTSTSSSTTTSTLPSSTITSTSSSTTTRPTTTTPPITSTSTTSQTTSGTTSGTTITTTMTTSSTNIVTSTTTITTATTTIPTSTLTSTTTTTVTPSSSIKIRSNMYFIILFLFFMI